MAAQNPVGKEENWSGLDVYVNWPTGATKGVVLASNGLGWQKPLLRRFADKIAGEGFVAVIPDFFKGDALDANNLPQGQALWDWFDRHPFTSAITDTLGLIKTLKESIKSVGVVGFCYGGKVGAVVATEGIVDATVILHPSKVTNDDIKAVKGPFAILASELDELTPVAEVEEFKKVLQSQNEVEYLVKVFPGVPHGWSTHYDENNEKSFKPALEAQADTIDWFKKFLK